jgi:Protein ChrB, N-terminal
MDVRGAGWVLLAYRLPREPSTPRITLWRKLRRLGTVQVLDGLVALPLDARTREQLEWLAEEVLEAGGEAAVWLGQPGSRAQERTLAARMAAAIAEQYRAVSRDAADAAAEPSAARRRTLARLRRELGRIERRDFFPPPERGEARAAVERLAAVEDVAA